ncbi:flavodoxin [Sulfurospirillum barnesii]|uniref:Flavodoxin n=1 Tax=Sulfurospirillum barnesii (strain ATCC 700032 / DSM 10660 / SES-3) TaxID=760154 RepID=I3XWI5_SULBS|nr:flavodoxin [Sulfurospirillum barnesii]AFL68309.1 flavodoxin, long chain [Sulfurospirillum barnesii SES-3]
MAKIGIFYASAGGNTRQIAEALKEAFALEDEACVFMEDDFDSVEQFENFDVLFLGSSTWGQGDVHFSWVDALLEIGSENLSFEGKTMAFFGAGDSQKHGEHFCSALGKFYDIFSKRGAKIIGFSDASDYSYEASLALIDNKFCGLAIDHINEPEKTALRIENWIAQLQSECM